MHDSNPQILCIKHIWKHFCHAIGGRRRKILLLSGEVKKEGSHMMAQRLWEENKSVGIKTDCEWASTLTTRKRYTAAGFVRLFHILFPSGSVVIEEKWMNLTNGCSSIETFPADLNFPIGSHRGLTKVEPSCSHGA
jgi:hypothetical protein